MARSEGRLWSTPALGVWPGCLLICLCVASAQGGTSSTADRAFPSSPHAVCVGDCTNDDSVTVDELITMVNIALGNTGVCSAGDANLDGGITIDEIVTAVNNALSGCGAEPPPTPSLTPTATPTPGLPDVSGSWREDQYVLRSSECDGDFTAFVVDAVQQPPVCDYRISQNGASITAVDCNANSVSGTVDATATIRLSQPEETDTEQGCTIAESVDASIDASHSPTVAVGTLRFRFSGACAPLFNCTIVIQSRWIKL